MCWRWRDKGLPMQVHTGLSWQLVKQSHLESLPQVILRAACFLQRLSRITGSSGRCLCSTHMPRVLAITVYFRTALLKAPTALPSRASARSAGQPSALDHLTRREDPEALHPPSVKGLRAVFCALIHSSSAALSSRHPMGNPPNHTPLSHSTSNQLLGLKFSSQSWLLRKPNWRP